MTEEEPKRISVTYTEEELYARLDDLNRDEDVQLFLRVQRGMAKFDELQKFSGQLKK